MRYFHAPGGDKLPSGIKRQNYRDFTSALSRICVPSAVLVSRGANFSILKHSRTSPTFTSLKFEMPTPHSKPARTSLASSLNRRSELTRPV